MPAVKRTRMLVLFWKAHRALYRLSGGRIGSTVSGMPVLLLTTTGRRSGEPRTAALPHLREGDRLVVVGSNTGQDRDPSWMLNLRAQPQATVQVGSRTWRVRASEAAGAERERLWAEVVRRNRSYEEYQRRTTRQIPMVILEPI